jgi:hypothetical protein
MQFKRRQLLVLLLIVSQIGCMSFGVLWASSWLRHAFQDFTERSSQAQGRAIVEQLARKMSDRGFDEVKPGTSEWQRLQKLCERIRPPHQGFVSVLDRRTGALICHSQLKGEPALLRKHPGRAGLVTASGVAPLIEAARQAEIKTKSPAFGEVEVDGQLYQATCLSLSKQDAVIAVYQAQASIDQSVAELVTQWRSLAAATRSSSAWRNWPNRATKTPHSIWNGCEPT